MPYGPVDFVPMDKADTEHLKSYGVLACLGYGLIRGETEAKLAAAADNGSQVIVGAQDFPTPGGNVSGTPFGLTFDKGSTKVEGEVTGMPEILGGKSGTFSGNLFSAKGEGWETVASVNGTPLILRKK